MVDPYDGPSGLYALALSADIDPGTSAGTRLFGHELVVWRDAAGAAHVWEDRCPHRGMRLSFGFVRGDHIACLYHGWRYDTAGQCRYIPAHPDLDVGPMIRARTYPTTERHGLVWVAWGAPVPPETDAPAGVPTPLRSLHLEAPAARVFDVLGVPAGDDGIVKTSLGGSAVLVAVQPLGVAQSVAHVLIDAPADAVDSAERTQIAHACIALRRSVEAGAAAIRAAS